MPVEFIVMIGTRDEPETRLTLGPAIDCGYVRRFARAREDTGFDRVLIGYSSPRPDGTQVAAHAAARTAGLAWNRNLTRWHRVGFISDPKPTPFAGSVEIVTTEIQRWFDARALDGLNIHISRPAHWRMARQEGHGHA